MTRHFHDSFVSGLLKLLLAYGWSHNSLCTSVLLDLHNTLVLIPGDRDSLVCGINTSPCTIANLPFTNFDMHLRIQLSFCVCVCVGRGGRLGEGTQVRVPTTTTENSTDLCHYSFLGGTQIHFRKKMSDLPSARGPPKTIDNLTAFSIFMSKKNLRFLMNESWC